MVAYRGRSSRPLVRRRPWLMCGRRDERFAKRSGPHVSTTNDISTLLFQRKLGMKMNMSFSLSGLACSIIKGIAAAERSVAPCDGGRTIPRDTDIECKWESEPGPCLVNLRPTAPGQHSFETQRKTPTNPPTENAAHPHPSFSGLRCAAAGGNVNAYAQSRRHGQTPAGCQASDEEHDHRVRKSKRTKSSIIIMSCVVARANWAQGLAQHCHQRLSFGGMRKGSEECFLSHASN
jgi:hypothetical protein